ncbi:putative transcription factor PosF21 [Acorus calamus]|uniref:Transcription factor PosF21 n=1 Tax=Acorus calamus TaxID=4465 RepID=A0AAV9EKC7_ACOCL|nr:putative transcription factor PosF21 [Acorus calamus]
MERERSGGGVGLPPHSSSRYPTFPSLVKLEPSPPSPVSPSPSDVGGRFSHDISRMPDFPPRNNLGHRRAHSEILSLPDDISFDSDLGVVGSAADSGGPALSDEGEEDLLSMYLDFDKFPSSSRTSGEPSPETNSMVGASASVGPIEPGEKSVRVRHQHSQSMDGSTLVRSDMLGSCSGNGEGLSLAEAKKAMSAQKLAELALVDPKRAKRIWANRQSAARSKERKMRYISELERKVQCLQTEATTLSAQLTMLQNSNVVLDYDGQRDTSGLTAENNELKVRLQTVEQQVHLQDALNTALREEVQRLKFLTGQATGSGGQTMNFASSFGCNPYQQNSKVHTLLAAQQLQNLQIQRQQQMHQHNHHQQQQQSLDSRN